MQDYYLRWITTYSGLVLMLPLCLRRNSSLILQKYLSYKYIYNLKPAAAFIEPLVNIILYILYILGLRKSPGSLENSGFLR